MTLELLQVTFDFAEKVVPRLPDVIRPVLLSLWQTQHLEFVHSLQTFPLTAARCLFGQSALYATFSVTSMFISDGGGQ